MSKESLKVASHGPTPIGDAVPSPTRKVTRVALALAGVGLALAGCSTTVEGTPTGVTSTFGPESTPLLPTMTVTVTETPETTTTSPTTTTSETTPDVTTSSKTTYAPQTPGNFTRYQEPVGRAGTHIYNDWKGKPGNFVDSNNMFLADCKLYDPSQSGNPATHGLFYHIDPTDPSLYRDQFFPTRDSVNGGTSQLYDPNVPLCTGSPSQDLPINRR